MFSRVKQIQQIRLGFEWVSYMPLKSPRIAVREITAVRMGIR